MIQWIRKFDLRKAGIISATVFSFIFFERLIIY